ncbi:GxxExxY protein [Changchengzhania lutea]|uniref:GxxExxY protein n=1 Tax=Changchengzhania lutea TaxID=2049305 RepID=UPI00115F6677|nr:GxxExxY protein [Changchengzhania lutea]
MSTLYHKEEAYKIIGICMEVHNELGKGFNEIVYSDALEIEFIDNDINYSREKKFDINYKGNLLPHKYKADFIVDNKIVLEIKAIACLTSANVKQTLNYLAVSKLKLGILINFGEDSLKYKRIVL